MQVVLTPKRLVVSDEMSVWLYTLQPEENQASYFWLHTMNLIQSVYRCVRNAQRKEITAETLYTL